MKDVIQLLIILVVVITGFLLFKERKVDDSLIELCDNYKDIKHFDIPIPIEWTAEFNGCLSSCEGGSFTRVPENVEYEHSRFSAYMPEGEVIPEKFRDSKLTLIISGKWIGIDADHPFTVFNGQCVPTIDIETIESI